MNTNERMNSTSLLVLTALITAMGTIATMFFKVPVGTGYIHRWASAWRISSADMRYGHRGLSLSNW